jgi:hypothetical protein
MAAAAATDTVVESEDEEFGSDSTKKNRKSRREFALGNFHINCHRRIKDGTRCTRPCNNPSAPVENRAPLRNVDHGYVHRGTDAKGSFIVSGRHFKDVQQCFRTTSARIRTSANAYTHAHNIITGVSTRQPFFDHRKVQSGYVNADIDIMNMMEDAIGPESRWQKILSTYHAERAQLKKSLLKIHSLHLHMIACTDSIYTDMILPAGVDLIAVDER